MKKFILTIICLTLVCTLLCSCNSTPKEQNDKLNIVTSCFPAYDFARELCGIYANITLLLKPGQEAHDYEPTPADIIKIQKSDLLICVGGENEKWVDSLINDNKELNVIKMLDVVKETDIHNEHNHERDEHVWTSPVNAKAITYAIMCELADLSFNNSGIYNKNFAEYTNKLNELDTMFLEIVKNAERKTVVFADRFPVRHFTDEYNLNVISAFPGCNSHTEPNASAVTDLIKAVKEQKIPAVFYTEFSNKKMAETVVSETGCKALLFHSCHNVTKEEFENGETYYSLMKKNAENLKTALS